MNLSHLISFTVVRVLTYSRWLFIINCIMTLVLGVAGFFMLPDSPSDPNPLAKWFTKRHAEISLERLDRVGRTQPRAISWAAARYVVTEESSVARVLLTHTLKFRRVLCHWTTWLIPLIFWLCGESSEGTAFFGVFLKALKDSTGKPIWNSTQVNVIPIAGGAVTVVMRKQIRTGRHP
jgi:hypothetical protein